MSIKNFEQLLGEYAAICNQAFFHNKDRFPFRQILGVAKNLGHSKKIEVRIIDEAKHKNFPPSFVLIFDRDHIVTMPHDHCEDCNCDSVWRVGLSYLENVIKEPELYIKNPARLNWEWLYEAISAPDL